MQSVYGIGINKLLKQRERKGKTHWSRGTKQHLHFSNLLKRHHVRNSPCLMKVSNKFLLFYMGQISPYSYKK